MSTGTISSYRDAEYSQSTSGRVAELFYPIFNRVFGGRDKFLNRVGEDLKQANIRTASELYLAAAFGYGAIAGAGLGAIVGGLFLFTVSFAPVSGGELPFIAETIIASPVATALTVLQEPVIFLVIVGLWASAGSITGILVGWYYAQSVARTRKREIDILLPEVIAFMHSMVIGGSNYLRAMKSVADADDVYGEASVEFQRVLYEMEYFNKGYEEAIENVADATPSDELGEFLRDMVSIIGSGGEFDEFLEQQQKRMRQKAQEDQRAYLDNLELFGQMYLAVSVLPIGGIIMFVMGSMMIDIGLGLLVAITYLLIPAISIAFAVIIGIIKQDEIGGAKLEHSGPVDIVTEDTSQLRDMGIIDKHSTNDTEHIFSQIRSNEFRHRVNKTLRSPTEYLKQHPTHTLWMTVPLTIVVLGLLVWTGFLELGIQPFIDQPYTQTVLTVYVPLFLTLIPITIFYEWGKRGQGAITDTLTEDIQKLANANETGQPLLESLRIASENQDSLLADEFKAIYAKAQLGMPVGPALVEMNNRYEIPRLARSLKLIQKANETSSNIVEVLESAATASKKQDEIEAERKQRTQSQVAIIAMTFFVFLGILGMLDGYMLDELAGATEGQDEFLDGGISEFDRAAMSVLFFHAITMQAIATGATSGYMQTGNPTDGLKFVVGYLLIALIAWGIVP